ncbi:glycoside hydrolase family 47 protein [candidate division KSB1 bacterium]|nr:glycoside hydrolase family 47 protein [candidate division KSB1 bacterium]
MKNFLSFLLILVTALSCSSKKSDTRAEMAEKVKQEFLHAWGAYEKYAWGHDALKPLSKTYHDWYGVSLLMTPVDAFDTMVLMGLTDEAAKDKKLILENLSFDKDIEVQGFEINIRLLGGLLSCYEWDGDERFLALAEDLGNRLLPLFDSPTGLPYRFVNLKTGTTRDHLNNPAEIGTYILEFGTLSRLTRNSIYYDKAMIALNELFKRRSDIGLVGTIIDVNTGEWVNTTSHISGMIDSYYEYLLKAWLLLGDENCKKKWDASIDAINTYLKHELESGLWYGQVDMHSGERVATRFGALDAFFPALLALDGDFPTASELQKSCFTMWNLHGIEPEQIDYATMDVVYANYPLRPEIIESAYYLYHYTRDKKYLDMGQAFYDGLVTYCKTDAGYAALKNVITKEKEDSMESFFLAETLKYLYLLFADDQVLDFDAYVFNTEAHPLKKGNR